MLFGKKILHISPNPKKVPGFGSPRKKSGADLHCETEHLGWKEVGLVVEVGGPLY